MIGQFLPPLPKIDGHTLLQIATKNKAQNNEEEDIFEDELALLDQDNVQLIEQALFWSEQADMKDMEKVLDLFKESP